MPREARRGARCRAVQGRIEEAFLARTRPGEEDLAHVRACAACRLHRDALHRLAIAFDTLPLPDLPPDVLAATERRATRALAGTRTRPEPDGRVTVPRFALPRGPRPELPARFFGELTRLLAGSLLPLAFALACNAALFKLANRLLAPLLPREALLILGLAYGVAFVFWLTAVYGSLPILAYRRSLRLSEGVPHV